MKKTIALMVVVMICFSLSACDPGSFAIDAEALDNVVSVELIEYANPNQERFSSWVTDKFDRLLPFIPENATTLAYLPSEKTQAFLEAFSKTDILHTYYAYNSPKDVCIKLNYGNGNFLIIWANYKDNSYAGYIGEYASNGAVLSFWGSFSALRYYEDLVKHFFDYPLE